MKYGMDLQSFAQKIAYENDHSRDFAVDTRALELNAEPLMNSDGYGFRLVMKNGDTKGFEPNVNAHQQIGSRLQIPRRFYKRMKEGYPELLADTVTKIFKQEPEKRLVRTVDDTARAFLSDRYRRIDNADVVNVALPVLNEVENLDVVSCNVSSKKMHLKALFPKVSGEIKKGDVVQAGIAIENSEVGAASLRFQPLVYRLECENGLISRDHGIRQVHMGSAADIQSSFVQLSEDTKRAEDRLLINQLQDLLASIVDGNLFAEIIRDARRANERDIEKPLENFVQELSDDMGLKEEEKKGVLNHLARGNDLNQWGACNAVTRTAQDIDDYDRSTELEQIGGEVVHLSEDRWEALAT